MKVVLFCGGYGMRMRYGTRTQDGMTDVPKPMTMVGDRPLLWHVMRYYAYYGHTEFVLCLGYGAQHIKNFFLHYRETQSNDFVLRDGGSSVELLSYDIREWTITFVGTGIDTAIGERLRRVRPFIGDDPVFLANYADVLTDAPIDSMIADLERHPRAVASLLAVPPQAAFHMVALDDEDTVTGITQVSDMPIRENGGYFVFRNELFDELEPGEDLVGATLTRLSTEGRVQGFRHDGFWKPADTVKEREELERMFQRGDRPWAKWDAHDDPEER